MSSPSAWPTGSSLSRRIPVDLRRVAFDLSGNLSGCPLLTLCRRIPSDSKNQALSAIPRAFQLAPHSLPATTGVKSAAYPMGRWRFTESLPLMPGASVLSILLMLECAATEALYTVAR